jgi:para-aminobenzoate synthetase/4-amino-4-deoxychorismate lyase
MKVIARLESTRREAYTGAIGIASPIAGLDMSVAIRTFETRGRNIWLGVGGGIVADSDPEAELAEALAKAAGPLAAIGGRLATPRPASRRMHVPPSALDVADRPDPAGGVFETVLVECGRPVAVRAHLERLTASLANLYGARLEDGAAERAREKAASTGRERPRRHRLRIDADPDGHIALTLTPAAVPPPAPVALTPFLLPGGLGAHKWRDRRLLDALSARAPGTVALLIDADGAVLEAGYANVWIVEAGALLTPPTDGRILPGITRAALLEVEPAAREEPITLERLARAEAVFLTSSIAGRHAARYGRGPDRAGG